MHGIWKFLIISKQKISLVEKTAFLENAQNIFQKGYFLERDVFLNKIFFRQGTFFDRTFSEGTFFDKGHFSQWIFFDGTFSEGIFFLTREIFLL